MTKYFFSFFIMLSLGVVGQNAFKNFGAIKMHQGAQIGFHTDLINDGTFDNANKGLAGFYSIDKIQTISGKNRAVFYDIDVASKENLYLQTSLGVTKKLYFIFGKVITPRTNPEISLDFINYDIYIGEDNFKHIDGYASIIKNNLFVFPIGDKNRLRPMILPYQNNEYFVGAYYFENPKTPSVFSTSFNQNQREDDLKNISDVEFWDLDGSKDTKIILTWNKESDILNITGNKISNLRVVGWNKFKNRWENLGVSYIEGDFEEGKIGSSSFNPNNYEILTFGSIYGNDNVVNYYISPNNDGLNDVLVLQDINLSEVNNLEIFNRWGNTVYKSENYKNNWGGFSEGRATIVKNKNLPIGTYFYVLKTPKKEVVGWIYITR